MLRAPLLPRAHLKCQSSSPPGCDLFQVMRAIEHVLAVTLTGRDCATLYEAPNSSFSGRPPNRGPATRSMHLTSAVGRLPPGPVRIVTRFGV